MTRTYIINIRVPIILCCGVVVFLKVNIEIEIW